MEQEPWSLKQREFAFFRTRRRRGYLSSLLNYSSTPV